jgi:hypothetical protein
MYCGELGHLFCLACSTSIVSMVAYRFAYQ